jgi:hypothetical protein
MVLTSRTFAQASVIDVSDRLVPDSGDAGVVEEEVNGLPVEFRGRCLDTRGVSDIHGQDTQFVAARFSQLAQLGSGIWITTSRVNLPAIG